MPINWLRALAIVVVATAAAGTPAAHAAPDAKAIADSLAAAAAATDRVQASYGSASAAGETITISDFTIKRSDAKTIVIPAVVITGALPRDPGGFTAQSIAFDGGTATRGKDVVTWQTGLVEDALVPSAEEIKAETDVRPFGKLVVGGLQISESNLAEPVTAEEIRVIMEADADNFPSAFAAQVSGIQFPADILKGRPQEKAIVDALGYESFDVNISVSGAFDRAAQAMSLNALTINTAGVGNLSVKARISGMSPGRITATRVDAEARSETKLENLEVRFDNAGVVERALDMHAALIMGSRADAVAQINAALPLVLGILGNDAFQAKLAPAIESFLGDPRSISFSATPNEPVSLEQIFATGLSNPRGLPDLLGADVSAN
jgi:hypothetical protein